VYLYFVLGSEETATHDHTTWFLHHQQVHSQ
jgi:hypothetical protein